MIPLQRVRTVEAIHPNFHGAKRLERNEKLIEQKLDGTLDGKSKKKWDSSFWKQAKKQLLIETKQKCAYCETPTTVIAYGDVEHFRPKSVYWWLAYSYENYLPSCTVCNQRYKKDEFPLLDPKKIWKGPKVSSTMTKAKQKQLAKTLTVDPLNDKDGLPLKKFINSCNSEYALIINPYFEDPADYLIYEPVLEAKRVFAAATNPRHKPVLEACEKYFGINRAELADLRFQRYTEYMTFRHLLEVPGLPKPQRRSVENRLAAMITAKAAYAGMIRYFNTIALEDLPWDFDLQLVD